MCVHVCVHACACVHMCMWHVCVTLISAIIHDFSEISYQLILEVTRSREMHCDGIEGEDEFIEFAMHSSRYGYWIPLRLSYYNKGGDITSELTIRGYSLQAKGSASSMRQEQILICGDLLCTNDVQFRWMGTSTTRGSDRSDMWALSSVTATLILGNGRIRIFEDEFGSNYLK